MKGQKFCGNYLGVQDINMCSSVRTCSGQPNNAVSDRGLRAAGHCHELGRRLHHRCHSYSYQWNQRSKPLFYCPLGQTLPQQCCHRPTLLPALCVHLSTVSVSASRLCCNLFRTSDICFALAAADCVPAGVLQLIAWLLPSLFLLLKMNEGCTGASVVTEGTEQQC